MQKKTSIYISTLPAPLTTKKAQGHEIYMLFAGWEVRMVKNCDRGLVNAAIGRRSQFFTIRTEPKPANNMFIFSFRLWLLHPITVGFVYATLPLNRVVRRLLTICKKNLRNEQLTQILHKERCIKEQIFFDLLYVYCIYVTC